MIPDDPSRALGKPKVRRAHTLTRSAARRARLDGRTVQHNWVVEFGALRLTYSSRSTAFDGAMMLSMWRMISPVGLVGMHREVEP